MATDFSNGRREPWALLGPDGSYYKLREPSFFVGRNGDVDLALRSRSVDKKHAVITILEEQGLHFIHDLDSLNGTFVNGKRVKESKLGFGDAVRFGYDMDIYYIDLYPCQDNKQTLFDENDNNLDSTCYQGLNDMHHPAEEAISKTCHGCGSKSGDTIKESRPESVIQGSKLYGQPSWWGWGSSDEEIYTYPNCATIVSQSGTSHCTVLQQRSKRNNTEQQQTLLKQPLLMDTSPKQSSMGSSQSTITRNNHTAVERTTNYTPTPRMTTRNMQEFSNIYNLPMFGAWEKVPHGSYVEGLEDDPVDHDSYHSKDALTFIPIVPDFDELPEKPVSEKSKKTYHRSPKLDYSPSSPASENSDLDYSPKTSQRGGVFGLTEVTSLGSNSPKGVKVGKPKHLPVKIKTNDSKSSTPRADKSRTPVRRNSSASSVTKESSPKASRSLLTRVPSTGGSPVLSDNDSRGSGQTPLTSTSDDSDNATNSPDKHHKRKTDKAKPSRDREVFSADTTDKGSSSLPRVNKTALLRARNSREALKTSVRRSSPLRSRTTSKTRHRRATVAKNSNSSDSASSSSLRIWSPSGKKPAKSPSQEKPSSTESSVNTSVSSSSIGDSTQAAVDEVFDAGTPDSYVLPKELQMNRSDSSNRTFVLENKDEPSTSSSISDIKTSTDTSSSNLHGLSSLEDTLETLNLSFNNKTPNKAPSHTNPKSLSSTLQADRPVTRLPQPDISDWMMSCKGRSTSPESFVSVPPASSPSPPSSPRTSAMHLIQERMNCSSAPPHSRRQWDITEKPVEDLMLSSVHAFTVELRLASELVLSKARNLYETGNAKDTEKLSDKGHSSSKHDSKMPEWKSSHAEIAGVFRNLRRVEFNLRTMDQALSYLCTAQDCQDGRKAKLPDRSGLTPKRWNEIKARARKCSWAEEHRNKFPGPPSDDEEVATS